jgi:hypothetical protein
MGLEYAAANDPGHATLFLRRTNNEGGNSEANLWSPVLLNYAARVGDKAQSPYEHLH